MTSLSPPDILLEDSDQEDEAQGTGGIPIPGYSRIKNPNVNFTIQSQFARIKESIISDDEGEFSPIGSPRSGTAMFGGREKFLELKRRLQEDQLNRPKNAPNVTGFENFEDLENWEGVVDIESLLQTIRNEQDGNVSISHNETNPMFVEMHDKIKERDIKLLNMESRMNELDRQIIDLQDTVSQRDKVISSKNEAVVVIQEKFRREAAEKEEELVKTQKTLFDMEKILSSAQIQWKSEKEHLNSEIQNQMTRMQTLEATNKGLEAKNFDFSQLESQKESLKESVQDKIDELNSRVSQIGELTTALETSKIQNGKLKTQFQNKLKALKAKHKEQSEAEIVKMTGLENCVTELEEEKGNLLLQLMDFDEQQAAFSGLGTQIEELESKAKADERKIEELESKGKADERKIEDLTEKYAQLQEENLCLTSSLERSQEEVSRLNSSMNEVEKSSEEGRVTFEMRLVELEEERDGIVQKFESLTEEMRKTSEKVVIVDEEQKTTTTAGTDTLDLITTCDETTTTLEFDQNVIGAKRARISSGNPTIPEADIQIFSATSLFETPGKQAPIGEQQVCPRWNEPAPVPFQYVNLDEETPDNFTPVSTDIRNIQPYGSDQSGYHDQPYEENQSGGWGGFDTADTFVQVKSPFSFQADPQTFSRGGTNFEIEGLQTELRILTTMCDNLKSDLAAKTYEYEQHEKRIEALNLECEQLSSGSHEVGNMKQELLSKNVELIELQTKLEESTEDLKTKEKDLKSTAACIVDIRSELDDKLNQIANSLQVIESFKSCLAEKEGVISRLTNELKNSEIVAQEKSLTVIDLSEKIDENARIIIGLKNELKDTQMKYEEILNTWDERETLEITTSSLKNQVAQMRGDLCQRDEELDELRKKLSQSEDLLDSNEAELMDLRSRENDMIGGYQKLSSDFDTLQLTYEQVKTEVELNKETSGVYGDRGAGDLEEYITPLKASIVEKDEQLKTLSEKSGKIEEKLKKAMIMLKQKNNQLNELKKTSPSTPVTSVSDEQTGSGPQSLSPLPVVDNQKEVEKWQHECMEKETKLGQIQMALQDLQHQVDDLTSTKAQGLEFIKVQEDQIADLENALSKSNNDLMNLRETANILQNKASEADANQIHVNQLLARLQEAEYGIQNMEAELTKKSNQIDTMVNSDLFNEVLVQRDELNQLLQAKVENIAHLESKIEESLAWAQSQIQFLEKELWDKNNLISQLTSDVGKLQNDIGVIEAQMEKWEVTSVKESKEKEDLLAKLFALEEERDSWIEQIKSLELLKFELNFKDQIISKGQDIQHELELRCEENKNLKEQLNSAVSELDTATSNVNQLNRLLSEKEDIIQSLDKNLTILETEKLTISNKVDRLKLEILEVRETMNQTEKVAELESSLSVSKDENALFQEQLREIDINYGRLNDELQKSREDALCLQHDREKSSNEWQTKIADLMSQLTNNDSELSLLSLLLQEEKIWSANLKSQFDEKTKLLNETQDQLLHKANQVANLEEHFSQVTTVHAAKLQEKLFENSELSKSITHLQHQLDETAGELETIKQQVYNHNYQSVQEQQQSVNFFQTEAQPSQSILQVQQQVQIQTQGVQELGEPENGLKDVLLANQLVYIRELEDKIKILQNELNLTAERLQNTSELQAEFSALSLESELLANENTTLKKELHVLKTSAGISGESPKKRTHSGRMEAGIESFLDWEQQHETGEPQRRTQGNWWMGMGGNAEVVEEPIVKTKHFLTNTTESFEDLLHNAEQLRLKDSRIYELEVQLTELEINLQDTNSQLNNLSSELEVASVDQTRVKDENRQLVQELESLRRARTEDAIEFENRSVPQASIEVEIPLGTLETKTGADDVEKSKLVTELRDLKLRNGKMLQRLKQLTDKYNALTKECESLKSKNQFSLDLTFEDEFLKQIKEKDDLLAENVKIIGDFQVEKERMTEKIDILERANEKIIEMNESQNSYCQQLVNQKKQLEQEISGLKWRLEEIENISASEHGHSNENFSNHMEISSPSQIEMQETMMAAAAEIQFLQQENLRLNSILQEKDSTSHEKNFEADVAEVESSQMKSTRQEATIVGVAGVENSPVSVDIDGLQKNLEIELSEKLILERKIELLQSKISEIEKSEIKCFEEALMLKSWTRQLEMDNLKYQNELEQIYNSASDGDSNSLKVKTLQNEVIRLVETLHERDKRCEELTLEITRMLEERDGLQLKLSNVLQHNVSLHEEANKGKNDPNADIPSFDREVLQMKLAELEGVNFGITLDLRREREARRLVQEQLLFSQSSRVYRDFTSRNKIAFSSPSPPPKIRNASPPHSPQLPQESPGSPVTPVSLPSPNLQI